MHQVGDQPRLYYDARSTNHRDPATRYGEFLDQPFTGPSDPFLELLKRRW